MDKIGNSKYVICVKIALIASSRKETVLTANNLIWKIIHNQICMSLVKKIELQLKDLKQNAFLFASLERRVF